MILIDTALKAREAAGAPVRVAMIGAGFMGRGIANQIVNSVAGMRLAVIANRTLDRARQAYEEAGAGGVEVADTAAAISQAVARGRPCITQNALAACEVEAVDAVIEVTGQIEFGAQVVLHAMACGKHTVLMNAELDGTVGPILKTYAGRAGVVFTGCDGDQPGVEMNLYRYVRSIGLTPLVCGNIKGLQDPYRTPATQAGFAARWGQTPHMVTSFADGTKISFEQALVGNATGMGVARRGMSGLVHHGHVDELTQFYDVDELRSRGGIVDYVIGARPNAGVFVLATIDDPRQKHYLNLYKMGEGPLYSFYTPWHLCHFEVPLSVARAVLFRDVVVAPSGPPCVEVVATAKRALAAGEILDGLGGYMTYGQCENATQARREELLPAGLAEGCRIKRPLPRDAVLTFHDVEIPPGRLVDRLWAEQFKRFFPAGAPAPPGRLD